MLALSVLFTMHGWPEAVAQEMVRYQIVENAPEQLARLSVTFDYLFLNGGKGNVEGGSADWGVNATLRPTTETELNGMLHLPLIALQKPAPVLVDGNFVLYLARKRVVKTVPVLLRYEETSNLLSNTISTSTLEVPDGNVDVRLGFRGGVYLRRNSYSEIADPDDRISAVTQTGLYGGVQLFRTVNLRLKIGDRTAATETGVVWYFDVMALGTVFSEKAVLDFYKSMGGKIAPFGARVGLILKPVMPGTASTRIGFFKAMDMRGEFGVRPLDKFFINMGVGWNFFRR